MWKRIGPDDLNGHPGVPFGVEQGDHLAGYQFGMPVLGRPYWNLLAERDSRTARRPVRAGRFTADLHGLTMDVAAATDRTSVSGPVTVSVCVDAILVQFRWFLWNRSYYFLFCHRRSGNGVTSELFVAVLSGNDAAIPASVSEEILAVPRDFREEAMTEDIIFIFVEVYPEDGIVDIHELDTSDQVFRIVDDKDVL